MTKRPNENYERTKQHFIDYRKHARQLSGQTLEPMEVGLRNIIW
jgi:hypothetical protein